VNRMSIKINVSAKSLVALALGASAILCGCKPSATPETKAPAPLAVKTVQLQHGPIIHFITLPGEIKAYQQATLYAKVTGYLKTIAVDKGDQVKEGTLLAEIEVPELLADQARYKAEVGVAELDYNRLNQSQKKAPDLVTPQSVDDAKGKLDIAKASLERTETLLGFTKITAPFSGIITKRMVDTGAFIPAATAGSTPQSAAIVTIADFNTVRLQVPIPESESSLVTNGEPVEFSVDGLPDQKFDGTITRFSYALDETSRTMLAEIEVPNPKLTLRPGMYATVRIGIERKADALLLPTDAVVTEKAGTSVFVIDEGKAKKNRVQTGFDDGTHVEIVNGLKPDQQVILVGKQLLGNGQAVTVSEGK
jgi:membrane fusion protein, multidrug efflux system